MIPASQPSQVGYESPRSLLEPCARGILFKRSEKEPIKRQIDESRDSYPPISSTTTKRPTFQSEGTGASAVTVPSAWSRPRREGGWRSYRNKAREAGRGQQWPCETEDPAAERGLEDRYPIRALPNSLTEASTVPKKETECPRSAPKRSDHEGSFHRNVYLLLASRVHS